MNHSDLYDIIKQYINEGVSIEDTARDIGDILNGIQAEKNRSPKEIREDYIDDIWDRFFVHFDTKDVYSVDDLADFAVMVYAPEYPNWTLEDMETFREAIISGTKLTADMVGKSPEDMFETLVGDISKQMEEMGIFSHGKREASNKSKENCGTDRLCQKDSCNCEKERSDYDKIREFLKHF